MSRAPSFRYFANFFEIPYTLVILTYITALVVISAFVAGKRLSSLCDCCKGCCSKLENFLLVTWATKFSSWLVRLVFRKSEALSDEKEDVDDTGWIYVEGKKLRDLEVNILATIILCFSLIMGIAAYSIYVLDISHTCSNDPAIYCYPQQLELETAAPVNPNLTELLQQPVEDCSLWVDSTITFQCFRFGYNGQLALAVAGGLLALFVIAMRITVSVFLKVFGFFVSCRGRCCATFVVCLQVVTVMLLLVVDVALAIVVIVFQLHEDVKTLETVLDPVAEETGSYVAENGLKALLILGTATLLLLIDWSDYAGQIAKDKEKRRKNVEVIIVLEEGEVKM